MISRIRMNPALHRKVRTVGLALFAFVAAGHALAQPRVIRAEGRFVYQKPDGTIVGVDRAYFEIRDAQPIVGDETLYAGYTQENGTFDVTFFWEYDDDPDLYVNAEYINPWVLAQVLTVSGFNSRSTQSGTFEDFPGDHASFLDIYPPDPESHAGAHIMTTVTRARRFIEERAPFIDIPDVTFDHPSPFCLVSPTAFSVVTHPCGFTALRDEDAWRTATLVHEYGHHMMYWNSSYYAPPLAPPYCNPGGHGGDGPPVLLCELIEQAVFEATGNPLLAAAVGVFCRSCGEIMIGCGHNEWCSENLIVAWQEGVPNWLGDVTMRHLLTDPRYDGDYDPSDGVGRGINFNVILACSETGQNGNPLVTEGFVAKLLVDMDDPAEPPPGNSPCAYDALAMGDRGVTKILRVIHDDQPQTVIEFLAAYRARFAGEADTYRLWRTARAVLGAQYVVPADDTQPPGAVTNLGSPTHPAGIGGTWPVITVVWDPPLDDASGAKEFELIWRDAGGNPLGNPVTVLDGVDIRHSAKSGPLTLGSYQLSIRARDCADHWGPSTIFGPFLITECNANGIIDVCETDCNYTDAEVTPGFCSAMFGCGTAADCGGGGSTLPNGVPDACDIAGGASQDCNVNGVPDECESETYVTWGGLVLCASNPPEANNWDGTWCHTQDGTMYFVHTWTPDPPGPTDRVCLPDVADAGSIRIARSFNEPVAIRSVGAREALHLEFGILSVAERSATYGPFRMDIFGILDGAGDFDVLGPFDWRGGEMRAPPGMQVATNLYGDTAADLANSYTLTLSDGRTVNNFGTFTFTGWLSPMLLNAGSVFNNEGTFLAHNDSAIPDYFDNFITGGWGRFFNRGRFTKAVGTDELRVSIFFQNDGLVDVQSGLFTLANGAVQTGVPVHTGVFRTNAGSLLRFESTIGNTFAPASRVEGPSVQFFSWEDEFRGTLDVRDLTVNGNGFSGLTFLPESTVVQQPADRVALLNNGRLTFNNGEGLTYSEITMSDSCELGGQETVTVTGTFSWTGGKLSAPGPAAATLISRGTLEIAGPGALSIDGTRVLRNEGQATFDSSSIFNFSLYAEAALENAGIFTILGDSSISMHATCRIRNDGEWIKQTGSDLGESSIFGVFENLGTIDVRQGWLRFSGAQLSNPIFVQRAGSTILNGGNIGGAFNGGFLRYEGGLLRGNGVVGSTLRNSGARVQPGLGAGLIAIVGEYQQSAGGELNIELGGPNAGVDSDLLAVADAATLGGTLRIARIGAFAPTPGQQFTILTCGSRTGTFGQVVNEFSGVQLDVLYGASDVRLIVVGVEPPCGGDVDGDRDTDLQDLAYLLAHFGTPSGATRADGDLNGDGAVTLADLALLLSTFAAPCP